MRRVMVLALLAGCTGARNELSADAAGDCGDRPMIHDVCVGVPEIPVCGDATCTEGVTCTKIWPVHDEPSLATASAQARSGECLSFAAGSRGDVKVVGGVHLLGRGAADVTVRSVQLEGTGVSLVRGLGVRQGGVSSNGTALRLDRVAVQKTDSTAINVLDASLDVTESTVAVGGAAGVVVRCSTDCPVGRRPRLTMRRTWVHAQHSVGVLGSAIDAELVENVIDHTMPVAFVYGRGLELDKGSTVTARYLRVADGADAGVVLFETTGSLGPGLELRGGVRGLVLHQIPAGGVLVDGFEVTDAAGVGIALHGEAQSVVLRNGLIHGTELVPMPVDIGGLKAVGDGIEWTASCQASVEATVTIGKSGRRPAVIASTARGSFAAKLIDGDDALGLFVLDPSGSHPALTIAPGLKVEYGDRVPVPSGPSSLP